MNSIKIVEKIKVVRGFGFTLGKLDIITCRDEIQAQMGKGLIKGIGLKESKEYVERLVMRGLLPEQQETETTLLIDDERNIEADVVARNYEEGIAALRFKGPFAKLYIDHDLASFTEEGKELTGYDVMCYLEEHIRFAPREIICVSANPVGRARIEQVIQNIYRRRNNV